MPRRPSSGHAPRMPGSKSRLDHRTLLDEDDESHESRTLGARHGIDFAHLLDEPRPGALYCDVGDLNEVLEG